MSAPQTPTSRLIRRSEADTVRKSRFFHAIDCRDEGESIKKICEQEGVKHDTGKLWLKQRKQPSSSIASRRIGKNRSGRPKKLSAEKLNEMLDPEKNPVRDQQLPCQIDHFQLGCAERTVQRALKNRTPKAGRYKKANLKKRVDYGRLHKHETIHSFWQFVHFTDEAHIDPIQCFSEFTLREEGTRYAPENLQERPNMKGVKFHIAASISWHHKGSLQFYNDEHDPPPVEVKKPRRPRKSRYENETQFDQRIMEWEASLPHEPEIKPMGNSMTMAYYVERLLPIYAQSIHEARVYENRWALLQEDNDPSHGTKSTDNLVKKWKAKNWISTLEHPPQSPDLNPIEAVWNLLKQKARRREWRTNSQFKNILLEEWEAISMRQIRDRIKEMPDRCKSLVETGGKGIKSALW